MPEICCVCKSKIGFWSEICNLEDEIGEKGYFLCGKCRSNFLFENDYEIAERYFETLFEQNSVDSKVKECIRAKYTKNKIEFLEKKQKEIKHQEDLMKKREDFVTRKTVLYDNNLITTGLTFDGYKIVSYHGIVSGDVVIGTGIFSELAADVADLFGTKSESFSRKITTIKKAAHENLIKEALLAGGNAVIGVDFDYVTLGNNMLGVSANGTAVTVEKL